MPDSDDDPNDTHDDPPARSGVDWEGKYRAESRRHRQSMGRITELEGELVDLRPKAQNNEQLNKRIADLEKAHKLEKEGWSLEKAAMGAGITDPEGIDVARLLHGRLPEQGRPTIDAWLTDLRKDPTKAPKPLQPYLAPADDGEEEVDEEPAPKKGAAGATGAPGKKRPNPNGGIGGRQGAAGEGQKATPEQWAAARAKLRAGDRSEFDALSRKEGIKPLFGNRKTEE